MKKIYFAALAAIGLALAAPIYAQDAPAPTAVVTSVPVPVASAAAAADSSSSNALASILTPQGPVATPPDPNYAAALNASVLLQQSLLQLQAARLAAKAACYTALGNVATSTSSDVVSKVATAVALGIACASGDQGGAAPVTVSIPAPPPPDKPAPTIWESILNAPAKTLNAISQFAPSIVSYLTAKVTTASNERVMVAQSQERAGLYSVFGQINAQGMTAISQTAQQGFITIGQIPQGSTTNYNVANSSGVGFGSGSITYNAATNSYNPVRNCTAGSSPTASGAATC